MALYVINPGALTTVQDLGRTGYQAFGMPCSGVMDPRSYNAANELVGNTGGEAALELTLFGGSYRLEADAILAVTGADMEPLLNGTPCGINRPFQARSGSVLTFSPAAVGLRTYLAAAGGFDVPLVLGSRSTNLKCGIGGFEGRALRAGDVLPVGKTAVSWEDVKDRRTEAISCPEEISVRVIAGPQADAFTEKGLADFYRGTYTVSEESDRMGCRLTGPAIESKQGTDIVSDGIVFGSIQVTNAGLPIVLLADRQTTGGYAKIATVVSSDLPLLAQARPGNRVRFCRAAVEDVQ